MIIAVTASNENNLVFQHFGKAKLFKAFEIENNSIIKKFDIDASASGHNASITLLLENKVELLICGGIGMGARNGLTENNIKLISGINEDIDTAISKFIAGQLQDLNGSCNHHHDEHNHSHNCNHKCH